MNEKMKKRDQKALEKQDEVLDLNGIGDDPELEPGETKKTGKWSKEEDDLLQKIIQENGAKNWRKVAKSINGRTSIQCLHRWTKILKPGLAKGPWSKEEDLLLKNFVKENGIKSWFKATSIIEGRSTKQIRERWINVLDPNLKKSKWSLEEEKILFELFLKFGSKWAKLRKFFQGRTENQLKNRFYSTLRKARNNLEPEATTKIKNSELLRYVPNVVENLKANVDNLPSHLTIESDVILYSEQLLEESKEESKEEEKVPEIEKPNPLNPHQPPNLRLANSGCFYLSKPPSKSPTSSTKTYNLLPFNPKSSTFPSNCWSPTKPLSPTNSPTPPSQPGIHHSSFSVQNKDCDLTLNFSLKVRNGHDLSEKEIEVLKYEEMLAKAKEFSEKINEVLGQK
ncbi:unnamed protein product [Moneuplotes crassus]|uniref:Myb-like DNA-binding domain containing protein n=1 Tax=Euplotes crassus TaxID=5936 RepID=A0AAD1UJ68_EUPCR|nr:unnamed protein product [Moneuplotes crassus]